MQNKNSRDRIEKIIAESLKKQKEQQKEFTLFGKFFYLKDPFLQPIDIQSVINEIESTVPIHLFNEVDEILVGNFDFLLDRSIEAAYKDGAIYIINQLYTEKDLLENIIHEASHSLEYTYGQFIYVDRKMQSEFLGKRNRLKHILQAEGYEVDLYDFKNTEYEEEFDTFLYKEVGYVALDNLARGLFVSPYAITSMREYWAVGFEDYFIGDREYVQKISPQLFSKIEGVITYED